MAENSDNPDIEFSYEDSDSYENEIAELYSYSEEAEFQLNIKAFEGICGDAGILALWQSMTPEKRFSLITRITDQMDHCNSELRTAASRALLYIIQGCWGEAQSDQEQISWVRHNCFLLLDCNSWSSCMQLLNIEIECWVSTDAVSSNCSNNKQQSQQYSHVSSASSTQLRIILSILCTMVETLRRQSDDDSEKQSTAREAFCAELAMPQEVTDEVLAVTLLSMVTRFCNSSPPHFPIRKLLLLLWKVLLVTLGGSPTLRDTKHKYRTEAGLASSLSEDTVTVCRPLRPVSPPALASDLIEQTQHNMIRRRPFRRSLMKQSSLDDSMSELELNGEDEQNNPSKGCLNNNANNGSEDGENSGSDNSDSGISEDSASDNLSGDEKGTERPGTPPPTTPSAATSPMPPVINSKGLPWAPKVRQKDIDCFLEMSRDKFVGYQLLGDSTTLTGLPPPIHEGVNILSKHIYTSLSEVQMKREEEIFRNPLSRPEGPVLETNSEILYQCLLPTLPQSMIALLKVLLAAAPTSKAKTDSINIMSDVLPEEMPLTNLSFKGIF